MRPTCERNMTPSHRGMPHADNGYEPCGAPASYLVHDGDEPWPICEGHASSVDVSTLEPVEAS